MTKALKLHCRMGETQPKAIVAELKEAQKERLRDKLACMPLHQSAPPGATGTQRRLKGNTSGYETGASDQQQKAW